MSAGMAVQLTNGGDQSKRRELDFYPTPPDATHALMQFMRDAGYIDDDWSVWEPACGNGAMSEVIKQYAPNIRNSDLRETGYGEGGTNFLDMKFDCDAIITNPPFNLSEQFIEHALSQASTVAMLLKSQYWHAARRHALFERFPPAWVLPLTWRPDFLYDQRSNGAKGAPTMEVHWTVWRISDTNTKYRLLKRPTGVSK